MKKALFLLLILLVASPAFAHKVNLFAIDEGGEICAEGYTADGRPTKNSAVKVFDGSGTLLHEGATDEEGIYCFKRPWEGPLELKLEAGPGHLATFSLPAVELVEDDKVVGEAVEAQAVKEKAPPFPTKRVEGVPLFKVLLGILVILALCGIYLFAAKARKG